MSGNESARDRVLSGIRAGLGVGGDEPTRLRAVAERLAHPSRNTIPARATQAPEALLMLFKTLLEGQSARVVEISSLDEVPGAVAEYLRGTNLPLQVRLGGDSIWAEVPWGKEPALERKSGKAEGGDAVGLSHALAAAAESGTLVLASGPDNPTTLNFLPENHIVLIRAEDIAGSYEDVWGRLRSRFGKGTLPRTVNFVSGPSRTADIQQMLVMGAHGPRRLMVMILGKPR
jgi:L-lactate dehydrogenase complex protein LldG